MELSDRHYKWILLLPAILVVVGLTLFPLVFSLAITFTNWDLYSSDAPNFAGLDQWGRLFADKGFLTPARNTVVFTAGVVPLEFLLGLIVALALMAPVMVAAVLVRALDAFKVVDIIATVTGGGPGDATESLTLKVYNLAVKGGDVAYGATASYALVVIMLVFATLFLLATRK